MKMITMWKDYYREVIIPSLNWINRYWKEYFLLSFIIGFGVGIYYQILFNKMYR